MGLWVFTAILTFFISVSSWADDRFYIQLLLQKNGVKATDTALLEELTEEALSDQEFMNILHREASSEENKRWFQAADQLQGLMGGAEQQSRGALPGLDSLFLKDKIDEFNWLKLPGLPSNHSQAYIHELLRSEARLALGSANYPATKLLGVQHFLEASGKMEKSAVISLEYFVELAIRNDPYKRELIVKLSNGGIRQSDFSSGWTTDNMKKEKARKLREKLVQVFDGANLDKVLAIHPELVEKSRQLKFLQKKPIVENATGSLSTAVHERFIRASLEKPFLLSSMPEEELKLLLTEEEFLGQFKKLSVREKTSFFKEIYSTTPPVAPIRDFFGQFTTELATKPDQEKITAIKDLLSYENQAISPFEKKSLIFKLGMPKNLSDLQKAELQLFSRELALPERIAMHGALQGNTKLQYGAYQNPVSDLWSHAHFADNPRPFPPQFAARSSLSKVILEGGVLPLGLNARHPDDFSRDVRELILKRLDHLQSGKLPIGGDLFLKLREMEPELARKYQDAFFRNDLLPRLFGIQTDLKTRPDPAFYGFEDSGETHRKLVDLMQGELSKEDKILIEKMAPFGIHTERARAYILEHLPKDSVAFSGVQAMNRLNAMEGSVFRAFHQDAEFRKNLTRYLEWARDSDVLPDLIHKSTFMKRLIHEVPLTELVRLNRSQARQVYETAFKYFRFTLTDGAEGRFAEAIGILPYESRLLIDLAQAGGVEPAEIEKWKKSADEVIEHFMKKWPKPEQKKALLQMQNTWNAGLKHAIPEPGATYESHPGHLQNPCFKEVLLKTIRPVIVNLN